MLRVNKNRPTERSRSISEPRRLSVNKAANQVYGLRSLCMWRLVINHTPRAWLKLIPRPAPRRWRDIHSATLHPHKKCLASVLKQTADNVSLFFKHYNNHSYVYMYGASFLDFVFFVWEQRVEGFPPSWCLLCYRLQYITHPVPKRWYILFQGVLLRTPNAISWITITRILRILNSIQIHFYQHSPQWSNISSINVYTWSLKSWESCQLKIGSK